MTKERIAQNDLLALNNDTIIKEVEDWDSLKHVDLEMALETELHTIPKMSTAFEKKVS